MNSIRAIIAMLAIMIMTSGLSTWKAMSGEADLMEMIMKGFDRLSDAIVEMLPDKNGEGKEQRNVNVTEHCHHLHRGTGRYMISRR